MPNTKGITLVSTLVFMFIVIILVSVASLTSLNNRRNAQDALRTSQAQFAAEAGLERAVARLWHQVLSEATSSSVTGYRQALERMGLTNGTTIGSLFGQPQNLGDGSRFEVRVSRRDTTTPAGEPQIELTVVSTGTLADGTTRRLQQVFRVARAPFPFDYPFLTNKADCIFCHLEVRSMDAFRGDPNPNDPSTWWRRIKVGVLEDLVMRDEQEAGIVHGSLVTRGTVRQQYSGRLEPSTRYFTTLEPGQTRIRSATPIRPTPADCRQPSNCATTQNLYYNYPDGSNLAAFGNRYPDGELPDFFPLPIPDDNNNRLIDDAEWLDEVQASLENRNENYFAGSITAPARVNPSDIAWPGGSALQTLDSAALGLSRNNVILDGSVTPITLSGTVFINGDVVIRGRVRGSGTILARGNVYILGDLTYDCGQGSTPQACDYREPSRLPQLNLIAGGNTLMGDFLSIDTFTAENLNLLQANRIQLPMGACRANPSQPGCGSGASVTWQRDPLYRPNLTLTEVTNFNRSELQRWLRNNAYRPRFYTYGENEVYFGDGCEHDPTRYSSYQTLRAGARVHTCQGDRSLGSVTLSQAQVNAIQSRAVRYEVTSNFFDNTSLKQLWNDSARNRPAGPLRTDGLLYSANAIFSVIQNGRGYNLGGRWDLRGALVAADTGVLAPVKLDIYHDARLRPRIPGGQQAQLSRGIWEVVGQ
ncbi:MAG: pilus assembly PilX N-terminal domain-containing protein [Meiothermus sp.]|nr:pilus assembly PilX N-terminal domain-containing protein [Meiothermus sp.]